MSDQPCPFLLTCWDTIEEKKSDNEARAWISRALNKKIDLAKFVADRRGKGRATEVVGYLKGSFNLGFRIRCDDEGPDAVIRFPKPGHVSPSFVEEKLINEVRTMEFIRQNTSIPVPFVHSWGLTAESPHGLGPFIIMDFVDGTLANRVIQKPQEDGEENLVLHPNVDNAVLNKLYRQIASYMLELSRLPFKHIGAISQETGTSQEWTVKSRPLTFSMNELATTAGYPTERYPGSRFSNARQYLQSLGRDSLTHLSTQRNLASDAEIARSRYIARHRFLQLVDKYCPEDDASGPYYLFCDDFRPANLLVDPETMDMKAVLDWEFTNAMPAQFLCDPPWWLLITEPPTWTERTDSEEVQEFNRLYEPRMEQFLTALEKVEDENAIVNDTSGNDGHKLSKRMRDSWSTNKFWFNLAARKSYDIDHIYWSVLHEGGNAEDLLEKEDLAKMETFIEKKMAQLQEYKVDYKSHFPDRES